ncbi:hypothetical protein OIO90_005330 [Microbotryomycetes sp. JL221]|nr:hypothetical protein OIO90_005330 [Microbotryomycetes sp. JL221]
MPTQAIPTRQKALIDRIVETPYLPWLTSGLLLANVPSCVKIPLGYPPLVQLPLYMIHVGDPLNGSGTTTGTLVSLSSQATPTATDPFLNIAWSLIYLFHARKALRSRRPGPLLLCSVVAAQAATFGYFYNDRRASLAKDDDDD